MFARKRQKQIVRRRPLVLRSSEKPPVMTYFKSAASGRVEQGKRATRRSEKKQESTFTRHLSKLPVYFSITLIAASLVYCSILGNKVSVVLSDNSAIYPKKYYEDQIGGVLNGSLFNHSKLTIDTRAFKESVKSKLPDVADVSMSIPLIGRKPVVGISLIPASFLFSTTTGSYVLGNNGVVLANARGLDKSAIKGLRILQDDVPLHVSVGKAYVTTGDISFIQTVISELAHTGQKVSNLTLPAGAGELYVRIEGLPYILKFALNGDVRQQVGAYLAVRKQLGSEIPSEYIDVRIGERVYVK